MVDTRKSLPTLKAEVDEYRELVGKTFCHTKSGENYQLLFLAFEESTNDLVAIYVMSAMPWLKFTRPVDQFIEKFEEIGTMK